MIAGNLHWVDFPARGGHEQAGRRPAIIAQDAEASARLPTVLVIPLTTQQEALRFPGTQLIEPTRDNGLRRPSVALIFQLTAVDQRLIGSRLGSLSESTLRAIWADFDRLSGRRGIADPG